MVYSFARIGAAIAMKVEDVFVQNRRLCVRLREKGGKAYAMPCHHKASPSKHNRPARGFLTDGSRDRRRAKAAVRLVKADATAGGRGESDGPGPASTHATEPFTIAHE
jgi:hypothetical protein